MDEILQNIVANLPGGDGWVKSDGEAFLECARLMYDAGMGIDDIRDALQAMYNAVRDEYGD